MTFSIALLSLLLFLFQPPNIDIAIVNKSVDTIYWQSSRKLDWDDFRGKPDKFTESVALTSSGIGMVFHSGLDGVPIIDVACTFLCKNSWVSAEGRQPDVLQHEQLHFDITELYARKLREAISKANMQDLKWPSVQKLYNDLNHECDSRQNAYDKETNHGIREDLQKTWTHQIETEMKLLDSYKSGS